MNNQETKAFFILLTIPVMWGITFPLIHEIVYNYSPSLFVLWRFWLAAIVMLLPFIDALRRRQFSRIDILYGLAIGLVNSGAFVLQAQSLLYIDSARAAFLTGMNVVMVPLLLPFFAMGRPRLIDLMAAGVCLAGIYLISGADFRNFDEGDWLVIASALCIAIGIIITEKASLVSNNLKLLTFYQIIFTTLVPMGVLGTQITIIPHSQLFWWGAIYCAVIATALPLFLQLKYQKYVGSSKVAIIFSLESVTATFCAWLAGEKITVNIIIGGLIILISTILGNLIELGRILLATKKTPI